MDQSPVEGLVGSGLGFFVRRTGTHCRGGRNPAPLFLASNGEVHAYTLVLAEDLRILVRAFDRCTSPRCIAQSH